jgi:hypothetical protein
MTRRGIQLDWLSELVRCNIVHCLQLKYTDVRFQVLTAASMMFRVVFWDVLPCKMIVDRRFRGAYCLHHQGWVIISSLMMEAVHTSETSVDNNFTWQYIPEDNSEHQSIQNLWLFRKGTAILSLRYLIM